MFQEEKLRKAIDEIEAKYGSLLNLPEKDKEASRSRAVQRENHADRDSDKMDSRAIPGLEGSYDGDSRPKENKSSKNRNHLEDKGNTRPPRKQKGEDRKDQGDRDTRRTGQRREEERERQGRVEKKKREERQEEERMLEALEAREEVRQRAASTENAAAAPAAMQTSLFIGVGACLSISLKKKKKIFFSVS